MYTQQDDLSTTIICEEDFTLMHINTVRAELLKILADKSNTNLTLDLSGTQMMDSSGIKLILGLYRTCLDKGITLKLNVSSPFILNLLELCRLPNIIETTGQREP